MKIKLSKNEYTVIDPEDFSRVSEFSWYYSSAGYAVREVRNSKGKRTSLYLHRFLLGLDENDKFDVDHVNRDKLDNRKSNLRLATRSQNCGNSAGKNRLYSKYKGVTYIKSGKRLKRWQAQITKNNKNTNLGYFLTEEEAAEAYNDAAEKYFGEFSTLNIIEGD